MSQPGLQRVLVPVDFSEATEELVNSGLATEIADKKLDVAPASEDAIRLASGLVASDGEIRLLHVTPALDHGGLYTGPKGLGSLTGAIEEVHRAAKEASLLVLDDLAKRYCEDRSVSTEARPGSPLKVILQVARDFDAELIVVAASGRSRVSRFFLGSTADRIIREATCPVLIIPAKHD